MIRMFAMCAILLAVSPATAQRTPVPAPQPPRPVRVASAADANAKKHAADYDRLAQKIAERDRLQVEIDQLRKSTRTPRQILVRMKVVEISLTKMRKLGIDFAAIGRDGDAGHHLNPIADSLMGDPHSATGMSVVGAQFPFQEFLAALTKNRVAKILAEPTMVVVSGRPGSFNFGGELPVPTAPDSKQAVEFLKFGTQVDVLAQSCSNNLVRMDLRVRVAEPDYSRSIKVAETRVPTLHVKECDTAFELTFGQSAVLTGMIERRTEAIKTEAGLKEELTEVALMFIATPESVDSLAPLPGG